MTWEGFWLPNLIQATVFAALAAVVGVIARVFLGRWYNKVVKPWLESWLTDLMGVGKRAEEQAAATNKKLTPALELREANGRLVALLPEKDQAIEYLKETNSRLVAQLVIQASKHPEDFDSPSAPRPSVPSEDPTEDEDDIWTIGRHSLRPEATSAPSTRFLDGEP